MKITLIGALGNIGKPLTKNLIEKGHQVTGIDNRKESRKAISELGAIPAIGDLDDLDFLINSFEGADAVFTMHPPLNYLDPDLDIVATYRKRTKNYAKAILEAKVKRVVNLSSMGAHVEKGNGAIKGAFYAEQILNGLLPEVSVTHLRPNSLYTNLYGYISTIRSEGAIYAAFGSKSMPWTSPKDVATAAAEELSLLDVKRNIRYVASEELTGDEVAQIIGIAIGKPNLKWKIISNQEMENKFRTAGMNDTVVGELTEMYAALSSGFMVEDYMKNKPVLGNTKLADFAKEFASVFSSH